MNDEESRKNVHYLMSAWMLGTVAFFSLFSYVFLHYFSN